VYYLDYREIILSSNYLQLHNIQWVETELQQVGKILNKVENYITLSQAYEVIDINKRKIIRKAYLVQQILKENNAKPFRFVCCKN
jgi:hypothetical protein